MVKSINISKRPSRNLIDGVKEKSYMSSSDLGLQQVMVRLRDRSCQTTATFQAETGKSIDYKVNDCWGSEVEVLRYRQHQRQIRSKFTSCWLVGRSSVANCLPDLVMSPVTFAVSFSQGSNYRSYLVFLPIIVSLSVFKPFLLFKPSYFGVLPYAILTTYAYYLKLYSGLAQIRSATTADHITRYPGFLTCHCPIVSDNLSQDSSETLKNDPGPEDALLFVLNSHPRLLSIQTGLRNFQKGPVYRLSIHPVYLLPLQHPFPVRMSQLQDKEGSKSFWVLHSLLYCLLHFMRILQSIMTSIVPNG
jgi:hypothetical protein